jgi:hypothetical protein
MPNRTNPTPIPYWTTRIPMRDPMTAYRMETFGASISNKVSAVLTRRGW